MPPVLLALGSIAHNAALRALALKPSEYKFAHAAEHELPTGQILLDSYHCSRYNTQTRRLTETDVRRRVRPRPQAAWTGVKMRRT